MIYHLIRGSQRLGTLSKEDLLQRYNDGTIFPTDRVWTVGMIAWEPVSKVFGAPAVPPGAAATPPPHESRPDTGLAAVAKVMTQPVTEMVTTQPGEISPRPNNNLVSAIFVTLCCCPPLGIVSIVFAAQVDGKYNSGDYAGAEAAAGKSRTFTWWSFGIGLTAVVIWILFGMLARR